MSDFTININPDPKTIPLGYAATGEVLIFRAMVGEDGQPIYVNSDGFNPSTEYQSGYFYNHVFSAHSFGEGNNSAQSKGDIIREHEANLIHIEGPPIFIGEVLAVTKGTVAIVSDDIVIGRIPPTPEEARNESDKAAWPEYFSQSVKNIVETIDTISTPARDAINNNSNEQRDDSQSVSSLTAAGRSRQQQNIL